MAGPIQPSKKRGTSLLGRQSAQSDLAGFGPVQYNNNNNNIKKQKKSKGDLKIFVIFSHVFPIILRNIGPYIYTVRYRSDIKIPRFLQNVSQKN